jgi:hypothetical protein
MSTTVIEALQNAKINFENTKSIPPIFPLAMEQLDNAIEALENGLSATDVIQETMFGDVNTKHKAQSTMKIIGYEIATSSDPGDFENLCAQYLVASLVPFGSVSTAYEADDECLHFTQAFVRYEGAE